MQKIDVFDYSRQILKTLPQGAFLNTAAEGKLNTMTIGWGTLGFIWGKQVLTVLVRKSRYTHELIEKNPVFTVSVPIKGDFKKALVICGTKSGRSTDKYKEAGIAAASAQTVDAPIILGAGLHIECRVVDRHTMTPGLFDKELTEKCYADKDWHTYYAGLITAAYIEN